jgi:hypothetical protein
VARVFPYLDLVRTIPAPSTDVVRVANEVAALPALRSGHAVLVGSAAWGEASWRSDIDVLTYNCTSTVGLEAGIEAVRSGYEASSGHAAPTVDVILVGAEHEELVERDNMVSGSVPILEPVIISELFDRVRIRLGDHVRALARAKGNPWRTFAERYLEASAADGDLLLDVLGEYTSTIAAGWREQQWSEGTALTDAHLAQLGYADGFAFHLSRMVLSHQAAYPTPDRRADIRSALAALEPWGVRFAEVLQPIFAFGDEYESVAARIRQNEPVTREDFDRVVSGAAARIDVGRVEETVWAYRAEVTSRRRG